MLLWLLLITELVHLDSFALTLMKLQVCWLSMPPLIVMFLCKGNMGMLDMVVALEWVHKYIGYFGGDPNQITIFGESAGSASIGKNTLTTHNLHSESKKLRDLNRLKNFVKL